MVEAGPGCTSEALRAAERLLGVRLPERLRDLYRAGDGRYRSDGEWWVVWPLERITAETARAWEQGMLPQDLLAFGDNGTGNPFCVPLHGDDEVILWSWIDGALEGSEGTLSQFLHRWVESDSGRTHP
jgi:cell wall assembly regulator SMI1